MFKKITIIFFVFLCGAIDASNINDLKTSKFNQIEKLLNKKKTKEAYSLIKAFEFSISKSNDKSSSNINYLKSYYYYIINDFDNCIFFGEKFINKKVLKLDNLEDKRLKVDGYQYVAHCYEFIGKYELSEKTYKSSLDYSVSVNYKRGMGISYSGIGALQYSLGKPLIGFNNLSKAYNLIQLSNEQNNNNYELSTIISDMGNVYHSMGEYELAIERYKEAINVTLLDDQYDYSSDNAISYFNISHSYIKLKKYDDAKFYIKKLELELKFANDELFQNTSKLLNVLIMIKDKDFESAENIINKTLPVFIQYNDYVSIDSAKLQLVRIRISQKRYKEALKLSVDSYKANEKHNDSQGKIDSIKSMALVLEKLNRHKEAYEHFEEYKKLYMTKNNANLTKIISELSTHFESKRAEDKNNKLTSKSKNQTEDIQHKNKVIFMQKNIINIFIIIISIFVLILSGIIILTKAYNRIARFDLLTQIYNRRHIFEVGEEIHKKENSYCVVLMDIDHFKKVNDTYGHSAGDLVLKQFTSIIKNAVRSHDIVGRYGGEEFVVILSNTLIKDGVEITERIRKCIDKSDFFINNDISIKVTSSFGIVESTKYKSFDETLAESDKLLYKAKHLGRNLVISL
jgi:diguanylate cyclase (GGDEF)-like protein